MSRVQEETRKLQTAVLRYCHVLTGNRWEAEDLAQETWGKAIAKARMERHANPQALMMRIARTTWIDRCRKRKNAELYERDARIARWELLGRTSRQHEERFELEAVFQALTRHLTPTQQAVFMLADVFGYSIAEAADKLDMTSGAVKSALHRARRGLMKVRQDLEDAVCGRDDDLREKEGAVRGRGDILHDREDVERARNEIWIRSLVDAYLKGDIETVIRLVTGLPVVRVGSAARRPGMGMRGGMLMTWSAAA